MLNFNMQEITPKSKFFNSVYIMMGAMLHLCSVFFIPAFAFYTVIYHVSFLLVVQLFLMFLLGMTIPLFFFGYLSAFYNKRLVLVCALLMNILVNVLSLLNSSFVLEIVLVFCSGIMCGVPVALVRHIDTLANDWSINKLMYRGGVYVVSVFFCFVLGSLVFSFLPVAYLNIVQSLIMSFFIIVVLLDSRFTGLKKNKMSKFILVRFFYLVYYALANKNYRASSIIFFCIYSYIVLLLLEIVSLNHSYGSRKFLLLCGATLLLLSCLSFKLVKYIPMSSVGLRNLTFVHLLLIVLMVIILHNNVLYLVLALASFAALYGPIAYSYSFKKGYTYVLKNTSIGMPMYVFMIVFLSMFTLQFLFSFFTDDLYRVVFWAITSAIIICVFNQLHLIYEKSNE